MLEPEESPENEESLHVTPISNADVGSIHAEVVQMHQADADTITAEDVDMQQSAAGNVKANIISAHQSALGNVEAEEIVTQQSATGMVQAEEATVSGYTGAVIAGSAEIHHSLVGYVAGSDVNVEASTRTVLLVARNVHGNVTTLIDNRSALIAGLTGGLFAGMMLLLGRMLFRRR